MSDKASKTNQNSSEKRRRRRKNVGFKHRVLSIFGRRNKTMKQRLLTGTAIILIVQYFAIFACLLLTGAFSSVRSGYISVFDQNVRDISNHIQSQMNLSWSDLVPLQREIEEAVDVVMVQKGITTQDFNVHSTASNALLEKTYAHLIHILDKTNASGCFIILNGDEDTDRKAALYIKKALDKNRFVVEVGPPEIVEKLKIEKSTTWEGTLSQAGRIRYYTRKTFEERLLDSKDDITSKQLGRWSESLEIGGESDMVMAYVEPLINSKGEIYGSIGVQISKQTVSEIFPTDELDKNIVYTIAANQGNQKYKNIAAIDNKNKYDNDYLANKKISFDSKQDKTETYLLENPSKAGEQFFVNVQPLSLYCNNAYQTADWAVLGISPKNTILQPYNDMLQKLTISILISGVFACIGMLLIISAVSSPIIKLRETLKAVDTNTLLQFEKTNIIEIDQLAIAAQQMSRRLFEANINLSEILELSNLEMGVFEHHKATGELSITDRLMALIGCKENENKSIKEILENRFIFLQENCVEQSNSDATIYKYYNEEQGLFNWIKLVVTDNSETTMGVVTDVTKEMFDMRKVEYERDYDSMTNLMSRRAFYSALGDLFLDKSKIKIGAMIMFDLDNLKYMNDTFGHDSGDKYIVCMAQAMKQALPSNAILSRISGDEFYAFVYGYDSKDEVRAAITSLKQAISSSEMTLPSGICTLRASGGVAWYPDNAQAYETLLKYSDFAMYQVKNATKGEIGEFDFEKYESEAFLTEKTEKFNSVIEENLVDYHFQPIVCAETGKIFAYEALMRGRIKDLINPQDILAIAKTQTKLYQVERLTWHFAFAFFDKTSAAESDCKIFINSISSEVLSQEDIGWLEDNYKKYLSRVVLELTEEEKSTKESVEFKREVINSWNAQIAIDDFGTGYNGEAILLELQPDLIKIDMTIVRGIEADARRQIILQNLIYYARRQNIKVIAEGVETYGEMKTLIESGVNYLQGYYLGMPSETTNQVSEQVKLQILEINKGKAQATE